ncbi:MAG: zinc ribbon domain-containing protein [Candidatus Nanopelagicaceae bacterium]|nr:zinc ribbon domain-containing protein [Candidatus Nanopelagicaceae bacterium]
MKYDYKCSECDFVFEVQHGMKESPGVLCGKCGKKCEKVFNTSFTSYTKGYGWFDKKGVRRDMDLHKLTHNDPYGYMRQPGEKSDLIEKLKKGGKRNPKRRYMTSGRKKT